MGNIAIRVEGLGKMYRIGGRQERYRTLRDTLADAFAAPFRRASSLLRGQAYGAAGLNETIWALKDVSFEVKHGEVVGIIGRNGAGKSTLLKILSRITEPTEGYADVYGRVGSLLEVGTGFHPELTGRENIYLNGAILGMSREEIDRKFDEIVDFAEIEKFIDTPVKHYSSGMGLRLGFAVAAHLEPEILVVDEVLAVGDAQFQKKCLGKMSEVAGEGRTVLFVSHNLPAVISLCSRAVWIDSGHIQLDECTDEAISSYIESLNAQRGKNLFQSADRLGGERLWFRSLTLCNSKGSPVDFLQSGSEGVILIDYKSDDAMPLPNVLVAVTISDEFGQMLFTLSTHFTGEDFNELPPEGTVACRMPVVPLAAGTYNASLWCSVNGRFAGSIQNAMQFSVVDGDFFKSGKAPVKRKHGSMLVVHSWFRMR